MFKKASIIIASRNEGDMLRRTIENIRRADTRIQYEIIAVDDGSEDGSFERLVSLDNSNIHTAFTPGLGIVPARSRGVEMADGDILVFCDAHISVEPRWLDELIKVIENYGTGAVTPAFGRLEDDNCDGGRIDVMSAAQSEIQDRVRCGRTFRRLSETVWMSGRTSPFETPVLPGACWAVRSDIFRKIGGYEKSFRGYGGEEEEISLKLWLNGYTAYATPRTCVRHKFRRSAPYRINISDFLYNRIYTALRHYNDIRAEKLLAELSDYPAAREVFAEVFTPENIEQIRIPEFKERKYDDDWFFSHFSLDL